MHVLSDADDARQQVAYWSAMGATSFKAYMQITRAEFGAAIEEAHKARLKVTGHLCSVTYAEAAGAGHRQPGTRVCAASTDFVGKQAAGCVSWPGSRAADHHAARIRPAAVPPAGQDARGQEVALTSTLTVFETFTPGRPMPPGVDVLMPALKEQFVQTFQRTSQNQNSGYAALFPKMMKLEYAFRESAWAARGRDRPDGWRGVIPGYSNQRQLELLVEEGFTPLERSRLAR
jgi:enamidase